MTDYRITSHSYRVLLQGDVIRADGNPGGFFAAREVVSTSTDAARDAVMEMVRHDWQTALRYLGTLEALSSLAVWRRPLLAWRKLPNTGHNLYDDNLEAQRGALRIEALTAGLPKPLNEKLDHGLTATGLP